tara:strand:+ start:698 stop:1411 length:714 start_codon:yes stop_codon:yes gene_type:complete
MFKTLRSASAKAGGGLKRGGAAMGGGLMKGGAAMGGGLMKGGAAVGRGISSMGQATVESMGRGYRRFESAAPIVSTAKQLEKQKFDLKMQPGTIISIVFLLVFYISVSALGVNVLNKCAQTDDSEKLQNIKGYFSHTLAMAIGVVTALLTIQLFTAELSAFYVLFSLMGAVGAFMLIHVINECDPDDKKGKMGYVGFSAAINMLMLFICLFMMFKGKKVVENSYVAAAAATMPLKSD